MDARDLSPASAAAEDVERLSATAAMAREAAAMFHARRYVECLQILRQLLEKKVDVPKVIHNIAIAEYFRDGCSDPRKLLDVLNKIKTRSEDVGQMEGSNSHENNAISGTDGSSTCSNQFPAGNIGSVFYVDEFDTSTAAFNIALILYHLHEYAHAFTLLEPLYQNIEPVDEAMAFRVCLLLLDVAFALRNASRAADVIQYLERCLGLGYILNHNDDAPSSQNQNPNQGQKTYAATHSVIPPDISCSDSGLGANNSDNGLEGSLSDEALEYEKLISKLDNTAPSMARPVYEDFTKLSVDQTADALSLKLSVQLHKVRLLLLTGNFKVAKREVKLAMNMVRGQDSSSALLLKAQLEYARGNYPKAMKLLMTSSNRTEPGILSVVNNNLGCIFYCIGKQHSSSVFFCKALRSSASLRAEKPLRLSTYALDKSLSVLYNCGLQNLACGKPLAAARCFHKASPSFFDQPLLWLRLAECCLLAQERGLLRTGTNVSSNEDVRLHVVGSGKWRQLVVEDVNRLHQHLDCMGVDGLFGPESHDNQYRLSLPFARLCLLNCLYVLNNYESNMSRNDPLNSDSEHELKIPSDRNASDKDLIGLNVASNSVSGNISSGHKETRVNQVLNISIQGAMLAHEVNGKKQNTMIKQAALGDLAYVELCLENPVKALSAARALREVPDCSRMYIFLSHVYAAEAFCRLNQPQEAAEELSGYLSDENNIVLPYSNEERERWQSVKIEDAEGLSYSSESQSSVFVKPEVARGLVSANFAIVAALQGKFDQADRMMMGAVSSLPGNSRVLLVAAYVDLLLGRTPEALNRLKQCGSVRFCRAGVSLSS